MTRTDFEVVADVLNELLSKDTEGTIILKVINAFCERFKLCNPRFDEEKFKTACGVLK